jgi:hypothetical protein
MLQQPLPLLIADARINNLETFSEFVIKFLRFFCSPQSNYRWNVFKRKVFEKKVFFPRSKIVKPIFHFFFLFQLNLEINQISLGRCKTGVDDSFNVRLVLIYYRPPRRSSVQSPGYRSIHFPQFQRPGPCMNSNWINHERLKLPEKSESLFCFTILLRHNDDNQL